MSSANDNCRTPVTAVTTGAYQVLSFFSLTGDSWSDIPYSSSCT